MEKHCSEYAVLRICRAIGVSTSGYYKYKQGKTSNRKNADKLINKEIKEIFEKSRQVYGSPRITQALRRKGIMIGKNKVARLMREQSLKSVVKRKFKATTNSNHSLPVAENQLKQNFTTISPNKVWASDITYIWTREGWLYLVVVIDIFTRQIISWRVDTRLSKAFVHSAIEKSITERKPKQGLIFHSDRGVQYASNEVRNLLENNHISQSMSRKGNCYDNAITETFFHTFKMELVYQTRFKTRSEAEMMIFEYIEVFYNRHRMHSSLNYLSPLEFEQQFFSNK